MWNNSFHIVEHCARARAPEREISAADTCSGLSRRSGAKPGSWGASMARIVHESNGSAARVGSNVRAGGVQSVDRVLELFEQIVAAEGELGLRELSETSGLAVGTVHRLIGSLVHRGYVRQNPATRRY